MGRRSRCSGAALAVCVAALVCAPAAPTLPGDPPIVLLAPGDGGAVPANPDGVPVTFSCPDYHPSVDNPDWVYGPDQYRVRFDASPTLGPDGLLGSGHGSPSADNDGGPDCRALLNDVGSGPEATGGRVYWQVFRPLSGGAGHEASPVQSFVVVPEAIEATLKARGRLWGGFNGLFRVHAESFVPDARVDLQRRAGNRWKTFASRGLGPDDTDLVGVLPAGRQAIRARIATVTSTFVAARRTVKVRRSAGAARGGGGDGAYAGRKASEREDQRLTVSGGGRTIKRFFARFRIFCLPEQVMATTIAFKRLKVAPDGSVVGHRQTANEFELVTGRLTRGRFRGKVELQSPQCHGSGRLDLER